MNADPNDQDIFPVVRAGEIAAEPVSESWLIQDLWTASAVGWVAGAPKSLKSWLSLEMAVSVATGTDCLDRYPVRDRGPVLVYLAEDSLAAVRERLAALVYWRNRSLETLDVHVVTASRMRLDLGRDQVRLQKTVRAYSPRLLVLDPLVRLHRADENSSAEVSALLAYLRALQRELDLSVLVVHHSRKNGATGSQGQGLRGSGDLWAWSDSALYLKRRGDHVALSVEHRSAPTPQGTTLRLETEAGLPPRLRVSRDASDSASVLPALEDRILDALRENAAPMTRGALRETLAVKNDRLGTVLLRLERDRVLERTSAGWGLVAPAADSHDDRSPPDPIGVSGNGTVQGHPDGKDSTAAGDPVEVLRRASEEAES